MMASIEITVGHPCGRVVLSIISSCKAGTHTQKRTYTSDVQWLFQGLMVRKTHTVFDKQTLCNLHKTPFNSLERLLKKLSVFLRQLTLL